MTLLPQDRTFRLSLAVGGLGLLLCAGGAFLDIRIVLAGWLAAALITIGLPLGAMTVLMIHGLSGGRWGVAMRPPLRAMIATLPLALLLLFPAAIRPDLLFPWATDNTATLPLVVRAKLAYLNVPFFLTRFVFCSAIWLALAAFVLKWTDREDGARSGRGFALGLVLQAAAVSVFSIDWMLSLDPELSSTIYGMLEASAEIVGAASLALLVLAGTRAIEAMPGGSERASLGEDVANMLFGFTLAWAYLAYMQWLVVWAGDLPNDIHWYVLRTSGIWLVLLWLVILLQFAVPFAGFLIRDVKRSHAGLLGLAVATFVGHVAETAWRVRPPLAAPQAALVWVELAALAAVGGLWAATFLWLLRQPQHMLLLWRRGVVHG